MSGTNSSVEDWLRSLGLITYTEAFIDNGYDELDICKEIGQEDLDAIGVVNPRDRTDILNSVARLKQSGTAVYFVLEAGGEGNYLPPQVQPRERYDKLKLKMLLHEKLVAQKISLTDSPYTNPDGSQGSLETLAKLLADSLYTFEDDVLNALDSLWERQAATAANNIDNVPDPVPPRNIQPKRSSKPLRTAPSPPDQSAPRHSSSSRTTLHTKNSFPISEKDKMSEDSSPPDSPKGDKKSLEYLNVEQPRKIKKEKRRRRVERNTKLSRSMDSLPTHQVNSTERSQLKDPVSSKTKKEAKSRSFRFFNKKKKSSGHNSESESTSELSHASVERRSSSDMNASEITMGEEDRMALMILVKQGDLTVEEAVEQLEQYEAERRQRLQEQHKAMDSGDEKHANKHKVKRGIFRSTKRKANTCNRPESSDIVGCEITMPEADRIQLMKDVRDGNIDVEHALTRLFSYEEQHGHGYIDRDGKVSCFHGKPAKHVTKSPKASLQRPTSGSIKRISGAISSVISAPNSDEPNAIFYTGNTEGMRQTQSSPDVATDSSAEPSPKEPHKPPRRKQKGSPVHALHGSTSSLDSTEKVEAAGRNREKQGSDSGKNPAMLKEIREMLAKTRIDTETSSEGSSVGSKETSNEALKSVPLCNKYNKTPPPQPNRKGSLPVDQRQQQGFVPFASLPRLSAPHLTSPDGSVVIRPALPPRKPPHLPAETSAPQSKRPPKIPDRPPLTTGEDQSNEMVQSLGFPVPPPRAPPKKPIPEEMVSSATDLQEQHPPGKTFSPFRMSSSSQSSKDEEIGTDSEGHDLSAQKKSFSPNSHPDKGPCESDNLDQKHSPKQAPIKPKRRPPPLPSRLSQESISSASSQDSVSTGGTDVQTQTSPAFSEVPSASERSAYTSASSTERSTSLPGGHQVRASAPEKPANSSDSSTERSTSLPGGHQEREVPKPKRLGIPPDHFGPEIYSKPRPAPKPSLKPKPKIPAKKPLPAAGLSKIPVRKPGDTYANIQSNELHGSSSSVNSNEYTDGQMMSASSSPGGLETSGESGTLQTHNNATNHDRNTLPARSKQSIKTPIAPKRPSHSLTDLIERRLRIEQINLAHPPYSDSCGRWCIPANLINRYSEELRRSPSEIAKTMDKLRLAKLRSMQQHGEPCDVDSLDLKGDEKGDLRSVSEWLISLGLPMYIENLREVGYDDMGSMPNMEERHFQYAGVVDPRHMRRLLASVELMCRDES